MDQTNVPNTHRSNPLVAPTHQHRTSARAAARGTSGASSCECSSCTAGRRCRSSRSKRPSSSTAAHFRRPGQREGSTVRTAGFAQRCEHVTQKREAFSPRKQRVRHVRNHMSVSVTNRAKDRGWELGGLKTPRRRPSELVVQRQSHGGGARTKPSFGKLVFPKARVSRHEERVTEIQYFHQSFLVHSFGTAFYKR